MPAIRVILEGDSALQDWAEKGVKIDDMTSVVTEAVRAIWLIGGTKGGLPSVAVAGRVGTTAVMFQFTYREWLAMSAAFRGEAERTGWTDERLMSAP